MFLEGPTLSLSVTFESISTVHTFEMYFSSRFLSVNVIIGRSREPNTDEPGVKKLGSHFPLSMIHTDMFVQGLLRLCCLSTNFTAVLKRVRKVDTFYVIEHICFQGIYVATDSALE